MSFEQKLISTGKIRQRNLLRAAAVASKKPDTGVSILKKSAYYVIKDCADITNKYLPLLIYGTFKSPIQDLKGKFTKNDIIDFVARSQKQYHLKQLLYQILIDINNNLGPVPTGPVALDSMDFDITDDEDVYGDYDFEEDLPSEPAKQVHVDINEDNDDLIDKLIDIFEAS
jgi:hypothetical protein